ncbi:MAG TPA: hypothetical protein DDW52_07110 [Planctomycetaceae bacterium]|nr:hypothetical protein [Planctomycetaceae bacterium]
MRGLMSLAFRITANVLLSLTISVWAVTRFQYIDIEAKRILIELASPGVAVTVGDWNERLSIRTRQRTAEMDVILSTGFDYRGQRAPLYECARWFPGGWLCKSRNGNLLVIKHSALIGCAAMLNVVVYGLWWRRRRRTAADD